MLLLRCVDTSNTYNIIEGVEQFAMSCVAVSHLHGLEHAWVAHSHVCFRGLQPRLHLRKPGGHLLHGALVLIAAGPSHKRRLVGGGKSLRGRVCLGEERGPPDLLGKADAQYAQEILSSTRNPDSVF